MWVSANYLGLLFLPPRFQEQSEPQSVSLGRPCIVGVVSQFLHLVITKICYVCHQGGDTMASPGHSSDYADEDLITLNSSVSTGLSFSRPFCLQIKNYEGKINRIDICCQHWIARITKVKYRSAWLTSRRVTFWHSLSGWLFWTALCLRNTIENLVELSVNNHTLCLQYSGSTPLAPRTRVGGGGGKGEEKYRRHPGRYYHPRKQHAGRAPRSNSSAESLPSTCSKY